ncbi:uncharacterized protein [Phaseolus vulgaris]|uniref:uncharacterized protein n=1 Tax=Phaseolus vulgaris TaxID=3885 RepID=UPI0035CB8DC9
MWHKDAFNYESHSLGKGYIATVGQHVKSAKRCCVVNVYAACSLKEKKRLLEDLSKCKEVSQMELWCFYGDFNAIRSRTERQGEDRGDFTSEIKGFNEFIESNFILDLPIVGKKFTWFISNGTTKSRIDSVLVSEEWLQCWPMCKQYVQRREVSDHCALMIKCLDKDWRPKPFRSIDAWHSEQGFDRMVEVRWKSYANQGSDIKGLKEKFKLLKADLKTWNKEVFGNLNSIKRSILQDIESFNYQDCNGQVSESERQSRIELVRRLWEIDSKLESFLRQKARTNWFRYGDSCSRFSHSSLRWRRLRNEVKGVEVWGILIAFSCNSSWML